MVVPRCYVDRSRDESGPPSVDESYAVCVANRLAGETSPYLLQHAHNPVDWFPWGEEALHKAKQEDKPILLSIGYSACHWCHVMERESFEDPATAAVMNAGFVNIKVDREERPDLDGIYMQAVQAMTGHGGWPMTVFLAPDGTPFYGGTYFPPEDRHNLPSFTRVLQAIEDAWRNKRDQVLASGMQLREQLAQTVSASASGTGLDVGVLDAAAKGLIQQFDPNYGGFGNAPKFPQPMAVEFLLRYWKRTDDKQALIVAEHTLQQMARGGVFDHLGGGFHRYSTDAEWLVPHFEKMLYDNAQLMRAYADAWVLTGNDRYRIAVEDIFQWLQREMTHPDGAFFCALDSESEGGEGKSYVWTTEELQHVLGREDAELFAAVYGFQPEGNYAEEATGERPGTNIPHLSAPLEEVARTKDIALEELSGRLAQMRQKLLAVRNKRVQPHKDDKVLASWNGLMISALAHAGKELDEPRYVDAAARAAGFIVDRMIDERGLRRSWRKGKADLPGYLDDYAFLADGLLDLYEATEDERWLTEARKLADNMLADFEDAEGGGLYFTSSQHAELIVRSKNLLGGGNLPSGNGVAAQVLIRLGEITGDQRYILAAERTLQSLSGLMDRAPQATESLILATAMLLARKNPSSQDR